MATLDQIRDGLQQAQQIISEGWHRLYDRAAQALTRFSPVQHGMVETPEQQVTLHSSRYAMLPAEVSENDEAIIVRLEVPGMEADQFELAVVDEHLLVVRGEKRLQREQVQGRYHTLECAYGQFERAIQLPAEVDENQTRARYKRGVLSVTLPKITEPRRQRINIQVD